MLIRRRRSFEHRCSSSKYGMCLKESCFQDVWKVSLVVSVFKNVGKRSTSKSYCCVILLSLVSKVFEKLV